MNKTLIRFLALFIPSSKKRKEFRSKHLNKHNPQQSPVQPRIIADLDVNKVDIPEDNHIKIIIRGKNNSVVIDKELSLSARAHITIIIHGDNNHVRVGKSDHNMLVHMGLNSERAVYNSSLTIGDNSWAGGVEYGIYENDTHISIGNNCMFSTGIEITCTDYHSILNERGEVINRAHSINIGNRVWIGQNVSLLKKAQIADGCIIGAHSVVTKKFDTPNCIIGGNPARVIKENVRWHKARPDLYPSVAGLDHLP